MVAKKHLSILKCQLCESLSLSYLLFDAMRGDFFSEYESFPVAQLVEHGVSNAKIMGLIPRESKS